MGDYDAKLGIYSSNNCLTDKLKERFLDKHIEVSVFDNLKNTNLSSLSYLILNLIDVKTPIETIISSISGLECKIVILSSLYIHKKSKLDAEQHLNELTNLNSNIGVLLIPEVLGKGIVFSSESISHDLIMQSIVSERVKIKSDTFQINTISVDKLSEIIIKETFSFGIAGHKLAIEGPKKTLREFCTSYLGLKPENIILKIETEDLTEMDSDVSEKVDFSLKLAVSRTRESFENNTQRKILEPEVETKKGTFSNKNINISHKKNTKNYKKLNIDYKRLNIDYKKILKVSIVVAIILFTPLFLILLSVVFLFFSYKNIFSNPTLAKNLIHISSQTSSYATNISFGNSFIYDVSNILHKSANIITESYLLVSVGKDFVPKITGNEVYNLSVFSNELSASLDKIHTDISFLQSDINELNGLAGSKLRKYLSSKDIDISNYKNKIYSFKKLLSRVADILGENKTKKYLILFQNNMELRPTGGFIGSFAVVTFDKGRMINMTVNDVYSADGQLKGHVDPPEPIRRYLGEGGWYMRDSNWDPDFPSSASKVEWFLDKEVGDKVDGVIAIDLNFVRKMLEITGPINLKDFNKTITSDNLYEATQNEVESDFFPGSIKKVSFLTSLSRSLITEIENLSKDKYLVFFKEIYQGLEQNNIQVFLHDKNSQEALDDLGYTGRLDLNTFCGVRCVNDAYSLVDANLGVNKSNYFINRSQEINLFISKEYIGHELFVTYDNKSSLAAGTSGVYKTYTRLIVPIESKIAGVRVYNIDGSFEDIEYEVSDLNGRREVGFYFELLPSVSKKIQIVWNIEKSDFSLGGEYNLQVIKQAGTSDDALKIVIKNNDLTLTGNTLSVYNTYLTKDYKNKLFFKP